MSSTDNTIVTPSSLDDRNSLKAAHETAKKMRETMESNLHPLVGSFWARLLVSQAFIVVRVILVIIFYAIGVAFYNRYEGWTQDECIYFITVTITTIGYGTFHPTQDNSRIFTVFYQLFGTAFILTTANDITVNGLLVLQTYLIGDRVTRQQQNRARLGISCALLSFAVFLGTLVYSLNEQWTAAQGFYWTWQVRTPSQQLLVSPSHFLSNISLRRR